MESSGSACERYSGGPHLPHVADSNPAITRVLFTGGPHGGKSSVILKLRQRLLRRYGGKNLGILCVRESATEVWGMLQGGPDDATLAQPADAESFQTAILRAQMGAEAVAEGLAADLLRGRGAKHVIILFDRGVLDGLAFVQDQEEWFRAKRRAGVVTSSRTFRDKRFADYSAIVHLRSVATYESGEMYCMESGQGRGASWLGRFAAWLGCSAAAGFNASPCQSVTKRFQDAEGAIQADKKLADIYKAHAQHHTIDACDGFELKVAAATDKVFALLLRAGLYPSEV